MSFTSAALILSWLAIAFLMLGFAALLQQVRALQAAILLPPGARAGLPESARALRPVTTNRRYVLTVDPGCTACADVIPEFRDLAARFAPTAEFALLAPSGEYAGSSGVDVLVDATAYRDLAPSWSPGIVVIDSDGKVLEAAPGGDLDPLKAALGADRSSTSTSTASEVSL
ncbi:hypothetical protein Rhe02_33990 [Rhizocola hellebori]|uniref:Thioredoxin domain-containing protein n=1 Tax=Rhizocola hellebori TaxID=1392758 RepID=A0A8J3Q8V2_9ACTN|nr:hypothetical protein [Rhizocola hellebori]GIH05332.1 hypothetical protein Rhe02_33990 [Rhizocola hellebori]